MYHKWQSYDVWFLRYWLQQTEFFVILDHFLPFYPQHTKKSKFWKNKKQALTDIIILHKFNKNHDHMLYCSLNMVHNGCNYYFSFWAILPFYPLTAQKIKTLKKWKETLEISSFYISVPKIMICYNVPERWHVTDVIGFFLFHFLPFYLRPLPPSPAPPPFPCPYPPPPFPRPSPPPLTAQKIKI